MKAAEIFDTKALMSWLSFAVGLPVGLWIAISMPARTSPIAGIMVPLGAIMFVDFIVKVCRYVGNRFGGR